MTTPLLAVCIVSILFLPVCSFRLNIPSKTTHCEGDAQRQGENCIYADGYTALTYCPASEAGRTLLESITANGITDS